MKRLFIIVLAVGLLFSASSVEAKYVIYKDSITSDSITWSKAESVYDSAVAKTSADTQELNEFSYDATGPTLTVLIRITNVDVSDISSVLSKLDSDVADIEAEHNIDIDTPSEVARVQ